MSYQVDSDLSNQDHAVTAGVLAETDESIAVEPASEIEDTEEEDEDENEDEEDEAEEE